MVVIGDVCGKGAEAAALTALARYTLRAAAIQNGAEPADLLTRLNEAILRQRHDMRFVSAVCAFVDPQPEGGATIQVCVAGHLPPLLVDDGGEVTAVSGGRGPVLGVWDDLELSEEELRLKVGQRLVLYTDGVLDAQRSAELTELGLAHLLGGFDAGSAADTVAQIERTVLGSAGGTARDDIAVLVLRPVE
jgi:serine phosphatase RsbU (regulator of sigma subunit)